MEFESRKGSNLSLSIILLIILLIVRIILKISSKNSVDFNDVLIFSFHLMFIVFFTWIYFGTRYILTKNELKYFSGPFSGSIAINDIKKIEEVENKVKLSAATASGGISIYYGDNKKIYISPITNESFIKELTRLNSNIKKPMYNTI